MKKSARRILAIIVAISSVVCLLAGCGSTAAPEAQGATAEQAAPAAEAAPVAHRTKVTVGVADNLEDLAPWGNVTRPSRYMVFGTLYQHLMEAETMG